MTNPRTAELGAGPKGKGCRTCKLVRSERVEPIADAPYRHICTATEADFVLNLAYPACGAYEPVFAIPDTVEAAASAARDEAKAKLEAKLAAAAKPRPIEIFS